MATATETAVIQSLSGLALTDQITTDVQKAPVVRRRLGDTEASYFLPSRESGVNDMYLMLGANATPQVFAKNRVKAVWAILRCRHPLLASSVEMENYEDIFFQYSPPDSVESALSDAESALEYRSQTSQEVLDSYLNGPRTLSDQRLSYLVVSSTSPLAASSEEEVSWDLLICTTHFLGDGMALHQFAHEFLTLLGANDETALLDILKTEVAKVAKECGDERPEPYLPLSLEERLPDAPNSRMFAAGALVDHLADQRRQIGGHSFPKKKAAERRTIVPTLSYDLERTKGILRKCKENGVSISSVIFALCNVAWARTQNKGWELPIMMYSALNIRPWLKANDRLNQSYFFLCIGFFNIVLPSFMPSGAEASTKIFWHRARSVKTQTAKIVKSPSLVARSKEVAKERGLRARIWGMQDDGIESTLTPPKRSLFDEGALGKAPSTALIGLSMLGNLDGIYKHPSFPSIKLHTLTTGSRQRHGGMLLFGYTFVGKLWLSLGYDVNGFDDDVVQAFWKNLLACIDEFL